MGKYKKYKNEKDGNIAIRAEDSEKAEKINSKEIIQFCQSCDKDLSPTEEFVFMFVPSKNYVSKTTPEKDIIILPSTFLCSKCVEIMYP